MAQASTRFDPSLIDAWVAFWNTRDLSMLDRLFLADDRVSYFSSETEGLIRGMEALRRHHQQFGFVPGGAATPNRLWLESVTVDALDPAAVVTGLWRFQRAGAGTIQQGPVTLVYVRADSGHRIAHAHFGTYA